MSGGGGRGTTIGGSGSRSNASNHVYNDNVINNSNSGGTVSGVPSYSPFPMGAFPFAFPSSLSSLSSTATAAAAAVAAVPAPYQQPYRYAQYAMKIKTSRASMSKNKDQKVINNNNQ
jgi:hypothetical protein